MEKNSSLSGSSLENLEIGDMYYDDYIVIDKYDVIAENGEIMISDITGRKTVIAGKDQYPSDDYKIFGNCIFYFKHHRNQGGNCELACYAVARQEEFIIHEYTGVAPASFSIITIKYDKVAWLEYYTEPSMNHGEWPNGKYFTAPKEHTFDFDKLFNLKLGFTDRVCSQETQGTYDRNSWHDTYGGSFNDREGSGLYRASQLSENYSDYLSCTNVKICVRSIDAFKAFDILPFSVYARKNKDSSKDHLFRPIRSAITECETGEIAITGKYIFFNNLMKNIRLYKINLADMRETRVADDPCNTFFYPSGMFEYQLWERHRGGSIFTFDHKTGLTKKGSYNE